MTRLQQFFFKEYRLVFLFCIAVMLGPAISALFEQDLSHHTDCYSYLGLAKFDFDQSVVRRYRVLVPFAAAAINYISGGYFNRLTPGYFNGDFSLAFSFFLVNLVLMGIFGMLVYRYCRSCGVSRFAALLGLMLVLSSRYTAYFAALPFVDALYCISIVMALVGMKEQNNRMLICSIFLGPFAKEAYLFMIPVIFFFSTMERKKLLLYFLLSGILVVLLHYTIDSIYPPARHEYWLHTDLDHFLRIPYWMPLLFSFYGLYKIVINLGFWLVPLLLPVFSASMRRVLKVGMPAYTFCFFLLLLLQMLLSGSIERILYTAMPFFALVIALLADAARKKWYPEASF